MNVFSVAALIFVAGRFAYCAEITVFSPIPPVIPPVAAAAVFSSENDQIQITEGLQIDRYEPVCPSDYIHLKAEKGKSDTIDEIREEKETFRRQQRLPVGQQRNDHV